MSAETAIAAAESFTGRRVTSVHPIAAGRTSDAWLIVSEGAEWVVRSARANSGRTSSYRSEQRIEALLSERGHPIAASTAVDANGIACSIARRLGGRPAEYGAMWSPPFARALAGMLHDLHRLDATGSGPLHDDATRLAGRSTSIDHAVRDRWSHARIWPFDGSDLSHHPLASIAPDIAAAVERHRAEIIDAASGPVGVVHSDLHREHLLVGGQGQLTGVLDFGDAFIGSTAWDIALLRWYYGAENTASFLAAYGGAADLGDRGELLALAVGAYKLDKNPTDGSVLERLRSLRPR